MQLSEVNLKLKLHPMAKTLPGDPKYPETYMYITDGNFSYPSSNWSDQAPLILSQWLGTITTHMGSTKTIHLNFGDGSFYLICKLKHNNLNISFHTSNNSLKQTIETNTKDFLSMITNSIKLLKKEAHLANMKECEEYLNTLISNTYEMLRTCQH